MIGSACASYCCDLHGVLFTADGGRLADGPLQRLGLRLGLLGVLAILVGFIAYGLARPLVARLCFLWALLLLSHNLDPYHASLGVFSAWW